VFIFPIFLKTGRGSPHTLCLSNLKRIGTATQIYGLDYDNRLPLENWMDSTLDFGDGKDDRFNCPLLATEPKQYGYAMNAHVVGVDAFKVVDPSKTIACFDTDALNRNVVANLAAMSYSRHNNSCTVVRVDTSAKRMRDPSLPSKP
jgi:hypothetical protein